MTDFDTCNCGHARCNHDSVSDQCLRCGCEGFVEAEKHEDLKPVEGDAKYNDPDWWKKRKPS